MQHMTEQEFINRAEREGMTDAELCEIMLEEGWTLGGRVDGKNEWWMEDE